MILVENPDNKMINMSKMQENILKRVILSAVVVLVGLLMVVISAVSVAAKQGVVLSEEVAVVIENASEKAVDKTAKQEESAEKETEIQVETLSITEVETDSQSPETISDQKSDYYLAYPGMLPDHPLYSMKMIRDKIALMVVRDKTKKAELLVLYADKRIGAADALARGGKSNLAAETALKAEKYLFEASSLMSATEDSTLWEKLSKSQAKHKEILMVLKDLVADGDRNVLESAMATNSQVAERVTNDRGEEPVEAGTEGSKIDSESGERVEVTM